MHMLKPILIAGALVLAGPASAQLVNGLPGPNYLHEAPIGTKGGGSPSSLQAPGEREAVAGALLNEREAKNMQPVRMQQADRKTAARKTAAVIRNRTIARNDTAFDRLKNSQE